MAMVDPLFDPANVEDPYGYYARLRTDDPVHEIPGTGAFLVTRMDLVREVVADPTTFSSTTAEFLHHAAHEGAPGLAGPGIDVDLTATGAAVLATADPPDHTRQRRILARTLSAGAMARLEPAFVDLVDEVLDHTLPTGRIEWMSQLAEPLPLVMVARILGLPDDAAPALKAQGYAAVEAISGFATDRQRDELTRAITDIGPVADAYTAARDGAPHDPDALIGVTVRAVADGELTELEAFAMLLMLVSAGGESTTSLTGTAARILAQRPDLQDRLRHQPERIPAFVEDACRIDPPFRGHYRKTTAPTHLGDVALPSGATVILAWPAANHDPAAFTNPDDIDLDRPHPRHHVGFGWGIHLCIGAPLARIEARVALERLLARTTSFSLAPDTDLRHHRSLMIRRLTTLPLTLHPHP